MRSVASALLAAGAALALSGCCADFIIGGDAGDAGPGDGGPNGGPPMLGPIVDRSGRANVATFLVALTADPASRDPARDAYNSTTQDVWASGASTLRPSLGFLDGLNTNCTDQYLADNGQAGPGRYGALASLFADDRIYVNTAATTCRFYLAVELTAGGEVVTAGDCGGRTPNYDVVDSTLSLLVLGRTAGIGDGIPMDSTTHSATTFPFLAPP